MTVRLQSGFACSAFLTIAAAFGQTQAEEPVKVVTVCDILLGGAEFNGKTVAVLGRFAGSDEGQWLLEDECVRKIEVNGAVWESSVWLEHRGNPSQATSNAPTLNQDSLKAKLEQAGKTTKLGKHVQYRCTVSFQDGKAGKPECGFPEVPDQWVVVYGRVETMADRNYGFGHLSGSPAQVFVQYSCSVAVENGREGQSQSVPREGSCCLSMSTYCLSA